jgi:hypothetical protein
MNRLKRLLEKDTRKGWKGTLHYGGSEAAAQGHGGKAKRDISINLDRDRVRQVNLDRDPYVVVPCVVGRPVDEMYDWFQGRR